MFIRIGISILVLMWSVAGTAQAGAARSLAEAVGLCEGSGHSGDLTQPACTDCSLYLVPLQGRLPSPELFFLESRSVAHCGSGGCSGSVYQKIGLHYQELFSLFGVVDRKQSRPQAMPPVIVYKHRTSDYDFNNNGLGESATVWAEYVWSPQHKQLMLSDILRIQKDDGSGGSVPLSRWRAKLLQDWRQDSPWVF